MDYSTKVDELNVLILPLNTKRRQLQNIVQIYSREHSRISDEMLRHVINMKFLKDIQVFYDREVAKIEDFKDNFKTRLTNLIDKCLELNLVIPNVWNYLINNVIQNFRKYKYEYNTEQYTYTYMDLTIENPELITLIDSFSHFIVDTHFIKIAKEKYDYSQYIKEDIRAEYQKLFYDLLDYAYDEDLNLNKVLQRLHHSIYWCTRSHIVPFSLDNRKNIRFKDEVACIYDMTKRLGRLAREGLKLQHIYRSVYKSKYYKNLV